MYGCAHSESDKTTGLAEDHSETERESNTNVEKLGMNFLRQLVWKLLNSSSWHFFLAPRVSNECDFQDDTLLFSYVKCITVNNNNIPYDRMYWSYGRNSTHTVASKAGNA